MARKPIVHTEPDGTRFVVTFRALGSVVDVDFEVEVDVREPLEFGATTTDPSPVHRVVRIASGLPAALFRDEGGR